MLFKPFNPLVPPATMQSSVLPAAFPFGILGTIHSPLILPCLSCLYKPPSLTKRVVKKMKNSKTIINCINFTIFLLRFLVLWNFNKEPSATFVTWSPAERCNKNGDFVKKNRRSILFRYVTCIRYHLIKDDWTKTSVSCTASTADKSKHLSVFLQLR